MNRKSQKGFTLLELMIAMMVSAIVILAVGVVLFTGQGFWNEAWKKVNLQRDASYVMLRMSNSIKSATSAQTESAGSALRIFGGSGGDVVFSKVGPNELRYQIGQQPQTVISDKLEALQFNVQGNEVTIDLKLKQDESQAHFVSTVMMRNYGG
ncbi:MAG: type II secretion system protein [Phycisphaerae bacterium]|nr:type II secretion system protein [Phycisphaerae bacterium]